MLTRVFGSAAIALLVFPHPQQQQPPVFRSGVTTVAVYATATDSNGVLVPNLTKDDFEVRDNGRLQDLSIFSSAMQPITAVLLVDTSASMALTLDLARQAAEQFILRMLPGDKARVGNFSDTVNLGRPFTGDRDVLLKTFVDDLHIGNPTRLWDALSDTFSALSDVAGRRVVVLFTDGQDTASVTNGKQVLDRAKAEDVMIYSVQIRSRVRPNLEWEILGARTNAAARSRNPTPTQVLRGLSSQTGGLSFALTQSDDVNATFTQVAHELHQQYLLGFVPQTADGRVHELDVRVKEPRVQVRARKFYLAPKTAQ